MLSHPLSNISIPHQYYTESVIDKGPFFSDEILDNNLISEFKYPDQFEEYVKNVKNPKKIMKIIEKS